MQAELQVVDCGAVVRRELVDVDDDDALALRVREFELALAPGQWVAVTISPGGPANPLPR